MIPDQIDPATQSEAERTLFRRLMLVEHRNWSCALHSLNLAEHTWKRAGEIDFLLIGPPGIFVLEVKGGGVACERGTWRYTNRYGRVTRKRASPFSQAGSAMFALQKRLEGLVDAKLVDGTVFGYAVLLPDQEFGQKSVEWADEMVVDRTALDRTDGVLRSLNRLAAYWRAKPGSRDRVLDEDDLATYLSALRPDFDEVPTLQRSAEMADRELAALTERQYAALDAHARNKRIVYEGGAGTGKTVLAVELCRRRTRLGDRVLFTCESPLVAEYVRGQPDLGDVVVSTLEGLDDGQGDFDVVVVDEAQDIMSVERLLTVEARLRGGFQDGRWYLFLDANNQRGLIGTFDQEGMDYVIACRPAIFPLNDNCRNTAPIVAEVTNLTGADVGVSTAGAGPQVEVIRTSGAKTAAKAAGLILDRLEEEGVQARQVMLLSSRPLSASSFSRLPGKWLQRIQPVDARTWHDRPPSRLGFSTVADFKGLESQFVILADVVLPDGPTDPVPELYVGMTRARVGLYILAERTTADSDDGRDTAT